MNRMSLCGLASLCILLLGVGDRPLDIEQVEASVRYINDLQNTDGGFRASVNERHSQLGATVSALRALKYLGGRPRDREGAIKFVESCYDSASGGFSDVPGGKPDVRSTAMGLMAAVELEMALEKQKDAIVHYFTAHASPSNLSDVYIAAAALHPAGIQPPTAQDWIAAFAATRNSDGSYGKGIGDTAGAVVTTLRLQGQLSDRTRTVQILKSAQRPDGGFSADGDRSDLATTYRVMRAFYMLKEKPDLARCRDFISKCRNADGGYGPTPGQPSTAAATYHASIVGHWISELQSSTRSFRSSNVMVASAERGRARLLDGTRTGSVKSWCASLRRVT